MKYKVNKLNKKGKEVWAYPNFINTAKKIQREAISKGINSSIFQKVDGKYQVLTKQ